jgi:hypothetical protein
MHLHRDRMEISCPLDYPLRSAFLSIFYRVKKDFDWIRDLVVQINVHQEISCGGFTVLPVAGGKTLIVLSAHSNISPDTPQGSCSVMHIFIKGQWYYLHLLYHELFHVIAHRHPPCRSLPWLPWPISEDVKDFVSAYAMESNEEDQAETFAFVLVLDARGDSNTIDGMSATVRAKCRWIRAYLRSLEKLPSFSINNDA